MIAPRVRLLRLASLCVAALIIPFGFSGRSARAQGDTPASETVNRFGVWRETLPSGLRLIVQTRKGARLAAIDLRVRVGSGSETDLTSGTAHLIEHLVFKGTESRKPGDFDRAMESLGGEIAARTTRDDTQYSTIVPVGAWREATGLLAEMLQNPAFRPKDIERERPVIAAEMAVAHSEATRLGYGQISSIAWGPSEGYRLPLLGTKENVARLPHDDLRAFWKTWYRPWNMTLTLAGDVTISDARRLAEALFPPPDDAMPGRPAPSISAQATPGRVVRAPRLPQAAQAQRELCTVIMAFRTPPASDLQTLVKLDALMPLLGGDESGRLHHALRVKSNLAHGVSAEYLPGRAGGVVLLRATAPGANAERVEQAIVAEIRRLREDGLGDDDAQEARAVSRGRLLYDLGTVEGAASRLAAWDTLNPTLTPERYLSQSDALTKTDLQQVLLRYLDPLDYSVVVIGAEAPAPTSVEEGR